jgi:hypothetical protein
MMGHLAIKLFRGYKALAPNGEELVLDTEYPQNLRYYHARGKTVLQCD